LKIAETKSVREALALASLLRETDCPPIGEIVGKTGTGKTVAARAIMAGHGAIRVCAYEGMSRYALLGEVTASAGIEGPSTKWMRMLFEWGPSQAERPILILDEANKLRWQALEALRYLADECGVAVILVGTEIYEKQYSNIRTKPLVDQLGRRIGAKRVKMKSLDLAEVFTHVLNPRFGDVERAVASNFREGCSKGNWGEAVELAEECLRICRANNVSALTMPVLEAALTWTANRRKVVSD
jgi:hypothetical protein